MQFGNNGAELQLVSPKKGSKGGFSVMIAETSRNQFSSTRRTIYKLRSHMKVNIL